MKRLLMSSMLVLMVVILAACGSPGDGAGAGTAEAPPAGGPAAAADGEERPVLRFLMPFHGFDMNEDPVAQALRDVTGYDFVFENLPAENPLATLTAIIAAREEYDLIQLGAAMFRDTVTLGAFEPLNNLLDTYAPNVKRVTDPDAWHFVTMDGNIMGVPESVNETSFVTWSLRARMDMLREVGVNEMPTTLDEFYNALVLLRDQLDVIPMSFAPPGLMLQPTLTSPFGVLGPWNVVNGEVLHAVETPGMLEYITFMNRLFTEGLLDNEFATLTGTTANEKFFTGRSAMHVLAFWEDPSAIDTTMESFPEAELAFVPPLEHNGVSGRNVNFGLGRAVVVPRVSRNQEHAMRFVNATLEGDNFQYINIGLEGVHWSFDADGVRTPYDPIFQDERGRAAQYIFGMPTILARQFWVEVRTRRQMPVFYHLFEATNQTYDMVPTAFPVENFMPPIEEFLENIVMANEFVFENLLLFVCNVRPLDEWDDFIDEWKTMYGGDILIRIMNEWWAENRDEVYPVMMNPVNPFTIFNVRP